VLVSNPQVVTSLLQVLSAMSTPPQFRIKVRDAAVVQCYLDEFADANGHSNTAKSSSVTGMASAKKRLDMSVKKEYNFKLDRISPLEQAQKNVRKAIRTYSGINSLMQLINYKKSHQFLAAIRLDLVRVCIC
jgi:hypothetical protein